MPKTIERARGLYKNGSRWWMRVNGKPCSTGTADLVTANRIVAMVDELKDGNGSAREWLERVVRGDVSLAELYAHRSGGTLHTLAESLKTKGALDSDPDLDPVAQAWITTHLPTLDVGQPTKEEYARQIRALIPEGKRFPASTFTEDTLKKALHSLTDARTGSPLSGSTRRNYSVAWKLFWKFAKKRVEGLPAPFADTDWVPSHGSPRSTWWDHATVQKVLNCMEGEYKVAMTLVFGTGMELGALLAMEGRDVGSDRTVVAHGSKNDFREDRTIFVDAWAWKTVRDYAATKGPREKLFTTLGFDGKLLRYAFYDAQLKCGLVNAPEKSKVTGLPLWGKADAHTIHDARHTYCINRLLGLDGEPRQSLKYCAMQLGHADEQMVMRIYSKANIEQRLRMIELAEARRTAA